MLATVFLSFSGGFLIANSFNRGEIDGLKKENDRLTQLAAENEVKTSRFTLSEDDIRAKIAEADANPTNIKFSKELGIGLYRYAAMEKNVGLLGDSIKLLERVSTADPKDYDSLVMLGNAHFDKANFGTDKAGFKTAREVYLKASALKPKDPNVLTDVALTYSLSEPPEYEKAIPEFRKAIELDGKNQRALQFMIQALWANGQSAEAAKALEQLKSVDAANPAIPELTNVLATQPPTKQ
jgi:tetratricopeptide (TPR) repeat protein